MAFVFNHNVSFWLVTTANKLTLNWSCLCNSYCNISAPNSLKMKSAVASVIVSSLCVCVWVCVLACMSTHGRRRVCDLWKATVSPGWLLSDALSSDPRCRGRRGIRTARSDKTRVKGDSWGFRPPWRLLELCPDPSRPPAGPHGGLIPSRLPPLQSVPLFSPNHDCFCPVECHTAAPGPSVSEGHWRLE